MATDQPPSYRPPRSPRSVEWPTLAVATAIYLSFAALTWYHELLPWWVLFGAGGFVVAWHGSLQHEVIHGHPTRWPKLNRLLVFPSLWLWSPFPIYRETHLSHHRDEELTHPLHDPESFYLARRDWDRSGPLTRALLRAHNTGTGRLALGPLVAVAGLASREVGRLIGGDRGHVLAWVWHAVSVGLVLWWVMGVCGLGLVEYLGLFVYPGLALTLLRSYAEHQARVPLGHRTIVVEAGALLSLLYLNNNLHAVHHRYPGLAWYRLPQRWRAERDEILDANGGYYHPGYGRLVLRHLLRPKEPVAHPLS